MTKLLQPAFSVESLLQQYRMIICCTTKVHNNFMSMWARPWDFQREISGTYGPVLNRHPPSPPPPLAHMLIWCVIRMGESGALFITHHILHESDKNTHTHTHTHTQNRKPKNKAKWKSGVLMREASVARADSPTKGGGEKSQACSSFSAELFRTHPERSHVNSSRPPKPQPPLWPLSGLRFHYEPRASFQSSHLSL